MQRAHVTAQLIHRYHKDAPLIVTKTGLRPWGLGEFEGKITRHVLADLKKYISDEDKTPKGGESFRQFKTRVLMFVTTVLKEAIKDGSDILCATHYRVIKLVESWAMMEAPRDFSINAANMSKEGLSTGQIYLFPIDVFQNRSGSKK